MSGDGTKRTAWGWIGRVAGAALFVTVVACGALYAHYRSALGAPILKQGATQTLTIPDGANWSETARILRRAGLVKYPLYFQIWARRTGLSRAVRAGTYHFEGPLTVHALAAELREGGAAQDVTVTFPEGLTIYHMADRIEENGLAAREAFLDAARSESLLERAGIDAGSFEGYLFPDTYRFQQGAAPEEIVWKMFGEWKKVWADLVEEYPEAKARMEEEYGLDRHGLVTLASIVQAETRLSNERPIIARVMLNRLDQSMKLQADPTCVYGPDSYDEVPSPESCKDPTNRYSTYVIEGLPPGPVGNPGRASLEAVLDPTETEEAKGYLFYCARQDGSGRHVFSATYDEHLRAVERHLK